jgi:4-amino-4-deoxy-L-arabinose transferase-like glycosyltransferase
MGRRLRERIRQPFWSLIAACATLFYLPLGLRALWDPDEGRYAEIAREMLELKDWVTPHLNYVVYFEKPPLMYWLTALAMRVLGPTPFAARFWCATFGLLTVALTYRIGKNWKGERLGLIAGGILATSIGFFVLTQFLVLDMALTFWTTLILLACAGLLTERNVHRIRRLSYLAALGFAGGMLTKGLIALVLPLGAFFVIYFSQGRRVSLSGVPWRGAILVFLIVTFPWFFLVTSRNPYFLSYFFIHEHFQRYLTDIHHRVQPFYFFIPVLLLGFLPWSIFLIRVGRTWFSRRRSEMKRDPEGALWVTWTCLVFFFFSLSHSKLAGYMAPVFPTLALLVANEIDQALDEQTSPVMPAWISRGIAGLIALFFIGLLALKLPPDVLPIQGPEWDVIVNHHDLLALTLGIAIFVLVGVWGMRKTYACIGGILVVQVLLLTSVATVAPELDAHESTRPIAERFLTRAGPNDRIVAFGANYENVLQSLPFYLSRRIPIYGPYGELALGAEHDDSQGWFIPEDQAVAAMQALPVGTWCVSDPEHFMALRQASGGNEYDSAYPSGRLVLFRKAR